MSIIDFLFPRPAPRPAPKQPAAVPGLSAQPPVIVRGGGDPVPADAAYRFDAICRDREQRQAEGRPRHEDHDRMTGEAMRLGALLLERGYWTQAQYDVAVARLRGAN